MVDGLDWRSVLSESDCVCIGQSECFYTYTCSIHIATFKSFETRIDHRRAANIIIIRRFYSTAGKSMNTR